MKHQKAQRGSETDLTEIRTSEIIRVAQERTDELSDEMTPSERGRSIEVIHTLIREVSSRAPRDPSHESAAQAMQRYLQIKTRPKI